MYRPWEGHACVIFVASALGGAACTTIGNDAIPEPAASLDEAVFRCKVEPILARQCSYNGCHGNAESALRVYTPGKLRATLPKTIDEMTAPLTEAEHHANFLSATGFSVGALTPEDNWLILKPLAPAAGGYEHKGGAVFAGTGDPQFTAIHSWLAKTGRCP